jgi:hypothetical protein
VDRVVDIITTWPTIAFTFLLAFCLVWWLLSLVVSGLDGDFDTDVDAHGHGGAVGHAGQTSAGHAGHGHTSHAGHGDGHAGHGNGHGDGHGHGHGHGDGHGGGGVLRHLVQLVGIGSVPLSLALTVLSFGCWSTSLLLSVVVGDRLGAPVRLGIGAVALVAGFLLSGLFARWTAPVFALTSGPTRADGTGARVRVRTLYVDPSFGDAEVLTGPRKNAIVRVRAPEGEFVRGDEGLIVAYDEATDSFSIVALDEVLRSDP